MCTYASVHFVIGFFPIFARFEPRGLIIVRHFPKKCGNAAMPRSGKSTVLRTCSTSVLYVPHKREIESCSRKTSNVRFKSTIFQKKEKIDKSELIIVVVVVLTTVVRKWEYLE